MKRIPRTIFLFLLTVSVTWGSGARAEDDGGGQDAESRAMDATATQWSFQFA